jgi:hypothetical protein
MRQGWDYVSMGDYQADMRESAETAVAVIEFIKGREKAALRRVAFLELALADALRQLGPGAQARVQDGDIERLPDTSVSLIFEQFEYDRTNRVRLGKPRTETAEKQTETTV